MKWFYLALLSIFLALPVNAIPLPSNVGLGGGVITNCTVAQVSADTCVNVTGISDGYIIWITDTDGASCTASGAIGMHCHRSGGGWTPHDTTGLGGAAFAAITSGTNASALMLMGTGSRLATTGTGQIEANEYHGSGSTTDEVDLATAEVAGVLPEAKVDATILRNLSEDLTPQLGAALDAQNFGMTGLGALTIQPTGGGNQLVVGWAAGSTSAVFWPSNATALSELVTTPTSNDFTLKEGHTFFFEGSVADANETAFGVENPTTDRTITLPNADGTVVMQPSDRDVDFANFDLNNVQALQLEGTSDDANELSLSYAGNLNIAVTIPAATQDGAEVMMTPLPGAFPFQMEGATVDAFETTITVTDPTADRFIVIPDVSGIFAMRADHPLVTYSSSDAAPTCGGVVSGDLSYDSVNKKLYLCEGATARLMNQHFAYTFSAGITGIDTEVGDCLNFWGNSTQPSACDNPGDNVRNNGVPLPSNAFIDALTCQVEETTTGWDASDSMTYRVVERGMSAGQTILQVGGSLTITEAEATFDGYGESVNVRASSTYNPTVLSVELDAAVDPGSDLVLQVACTVTGWLL